jgi:hypothetical protein
MLLSILSEIDEDKDMSTLILPVAGASSRYPGMRPKWLMTMPSGELMLNAAVGSLDMNNFSSIIVVALKEHVDQYISEDSIIQSFYDYGIKNLVKVVVLETRTSNQPETVVKALKKLEIQGSIYIKDCDNVFEDQFKGSNSVSVLDLHKMELVDAKSKSYVLTNERGVITNIVEKTIISDTFCCGGYGFANEKEFIEAYEAVKNHRDLYISHIVKYMITNGKEFIATEADNYIDWGTLREWRNYTGSFATVFCDIDGVLLENGGKYLRNGWGLTPIEKNVQYLKSMIENNRITLVLTTSRDNSVIQSTLQALSEAGLQWHGVVCNLPHQQRILVNDFSNSNPYPSAYSINLERDSNTLGEMLNGLVNRAIN